MTAALLLLESVSAVCQVIGILSSEVFERRTSIGSEPFSLLICLDATKFLLLSVFTLTETICPKFVQNHGRGVQKVYFRLKRVAQKRRFFNSLLNIKPI